MGGRILSRPAPRPWAPWLALLALALLAWAALGMPWVLR